MDGGKAWPFFLFWLDLPEVTSDSESENSNKSPQLIGVLLSCICRTVSSLWRPMSLASSKVILELAYTNFWSAFQQRSFSAAAFSSANLTSSIRLLWQLLYYSTFLSDSRYASSSIWQTMFCHAIWKAFSTSLDGISTVSTLNTSTTCKVYASHVLHPSWCVVVAKWGISWMSWVLDWSPASNIFTAPLSGTHISLVSIAGSLF